MTTNSNVTGPLKGMRVLDWTVWQFGPVSTSMMGDMGADVIKIESLIGDAGRHVAWATSLDPAMDEGRNAYFEAANRNKRSLAVDLKAPDGREIVYRLVESADVFVQNFRKGVAERLGMGYETLSEINPMLVYGSGTGYGPEGPDAREPSFDACGQARGGLMVAATPPNAESPTLVSNAVSDQIGAILLCLGVLAALVARDRQGTGQSVDASHLGANMWLQGQAITMSLLAGGDPPAPYNRKNPRNPLTNQYRCRDGTWIMLSHLQPDRQWGPFASVMGISDLIDDPRFRDMEARDEHAAELVEVLDRLFATRTYDEWDRKFREGGDFIYAKVQSIDQLQDDPQVVTNGYITTYDHPSLGSIKVCNHPNIYGKTPAGIQRGAPQHGEHTEQILVEELGYTWDDIGELQAKGVIL